MLRYVEADLERHGRLWFGITREVKPADVRPLTQSLLEGARKEFPSGDLVATVFDPDGERIGRAHLGRRRAGESALGSKMTDDRRGRAVAVRCGDPTRAIEHQSSLPS